MYKMGGGGGKRKNSTLRHYFATLNVEKQQDTHTNYKTKYKKQTTATQLVLWLLVVVMGLVYMLTPLFNFKQSIYRDVSANFTLTFSENAPIVEVNYDNPLFTDVNTINAEVLYDLLEKINSPVVWTDITNMYNRTCEDFGKLDANTKNAQLITRLFDEVFDGAWQVVYRSTEYVDTAKDVLTLFYKNISSEQTLGNIDDNSGYFSGYSELRMKMSTGEDSIEKRITNNYGKDYLVAPKVMDGANHYGSYNSITMESGEPLRCSRFTEGDLIWAPSVYEALFTSADEIANLTYIVEDESGYTLKVKATVGEDPRYVDPASGSSCRTGLWKMNAYDRFCENNISELCAYGLREASYVYSGNIFADAVQGKAQNVNIWGGYTVLGRDSCSVQPALNLNIYQLAQDFLYKVTASCIVSSGIAPTYKLSTDDRNLQTTMGDYNYKNYLVPNNTTVKGSATATFTEKNSTKINKFTLKTGTSSKNITLNSTSGSGTASGICDYSYTYSGGNLAVTICNLKGSTEIIADTSPMLTLTIDTNGGTLSNGFSSPILGSSGDAVVLPNATQLTRTGYALDGYTKTSGDGLLSGGTYRFGSSNGVVKAKWKAKSYTVTIKANNSDYGSVSSPSVTADYDTSMTVNGGVLTIGSTTVTATPKSATSQYNYVFYYWMYNGEKWQSGTKTVGTDTIITAYFKRAIMTYTVTINADPSGYGTVSQTKVTTPYGATISSSGKVLTINSTMGTTNVTATPAPETSDYAYSFSKWTYSSSTVTGNMEITATFTRTTKAVNPISVSGKTLTYTGSAQVLVATSSAQGAVYYAVSTQLTASNYSSSGSTTIPSKTNAGTYTIYYYCVGNSEYKPASGSVQSTINKADARVATAPTAKNLTYTGSAQKLVNAGVASGGTLMYSLTNGSAFSTTIPSGTNAQSYVVYYKVFGDANHNDSSQANITVTIQKKALTVSWGTTTFTYNKSEQKPTASVSTGISGQTITFTYSVSAKSGSSLTNGKAVNAGSYAITATSVAGNNTTLSNYELSPLSKDFTISRKALTITADSITTTYGNSVPNWTYTKTGLLSGDTLSGTASYKITQGGITISPSSTTNVGSYTITVSGLSNSNYSITYKTGTWTIIRKSSEITLSNSGASIQYGNSTTFTITYTGDGTLSATCADTSSVTVSRSGNTVTVNVIKYEASTTVNVTVSATQGNNYSAPTSKTFVVTLAQRKITIKGASESRAYNGSALTKNSSSLTSGSLASGDTATYSARGSITNVGSVANVPSVVIKKSNTDVTSYYAITKVNGTLTITKAKLAMPTSLSVTNKGIVTWTATTGATSYQISIDNNTWQTASSGIDYNSTIVASTGSRTVYVRAVTTDSTNYITPSDNATKMVNVYSLVINKGTGVSSVTGAGNYIEGRSVAISANLATGYGFEGWTVSSGSAPVDASKSSTTITINATTTLVANAKASNCTITVSINNTVGREFIVYILGEDEQPIYQIVASNGNSSMKFSYKQTKEFSILIFRAIAVKATINNESVISKAFTANGDQTITVKITSIDETLNNWTTTYSKPTASTNVNVSNVIESNETNVFPQNENEIVCDETFCENEVDNIGSFALESENSLDEVENIVSTNETKINTDFDETKEILTSVENEKVTIEKENRYILKLYDKFLPKNYKAIVMNCYASVVKNAVIREIF